jgi:hypothetical protein
VERRGRGEDAAEESLDAAASGGMKGEGLVFFAGIFVGQLLYLAADLIRDWLRERSFERALARAKKDFGSVPKE